MKNKKLFLLGFTFCLSLTSCTRKNDILVTLNKDESIVYDETKTTFADYTITLSCDDINNKLDNKESFVLILYSETCHICQEVEPLIIKYICEYQYVINSIGIYDYEDEVMLSTLQRIDETTKLAGPQVYFVSKGTGIYTQVGFYSNQRNYHYIKTTFNYYIA